MAQRLFAVLNSKNFIHYELLPSKQSTNHKIFTVWKADGSTFLERGQICGWRSEFFNITKRLHT
jgi:hypothetical protein